MNGGAYVVIQQNFPVVGIGHIVVLVGYDSVLGFKVKSSDENAGKVEWIPENRMTWYQYVVTEEEYKVVRYNSGGSRGVEIVENGHRYYVCPNWVENTLRRTHLNETGGILTTNFARRNEVFLTDFGFVLKFKKK